MADCGFNRHQYEPYKVWSDEGWRYTQTKCMNPGCGKKGGISKVRIRKS